MMMNLFFDFDGTLADTSDGIVSAMQYTIHEMGEDKFSRPFEKSMIGPPLGEMFRNMLVSPDDMCISKAIKIFREYYSKYGIQETVLYPNIEVGLKQLLNDGHHLYIVTSKPGVFVDQIMNRYHIKSLFTQISAVNLAGTSLTKAERIKGLMETERISATDVFMIGDRKDDVNAGNSNHIKTIGVLYGYGSKRELLESGCCHLVDEFLHIRNYLFSVKGKI